MIGARLRMLRRESGMTQVELGKILNCGGTAISQYEKNVRTPDHATIMKIADVFGVSTDYLFGKTSDRNKDIPSAKRNVRIPVLGHVQAGLPISAVTDILDWEEVTPEMANSGELFALQIKGTSMQPRMQEGDVIIVRQQPEVENGEIAVVMVDGDEATVKKVRYLDNGIMLIGLNPSFEPLVFTNEEILTLPVRIIGKVIELRAKF